MLFAAEFFSGMGVMILDINGGSIMYALTPDRLRSRSQGAFNFVNWGIRPIGSLFGGAMGAWIGVRPTLWVATIGAIAGALWLLPRPCRGCGSCRRKLYDRRPPRPSSSPPSARSPSGRSTASIAATGG